MSIDNIPGIGNWLIQRDRRKAIESRTRRLNEEWRREGRGVSAGPPQGYRKS